ncbi:hypothetical protein NBRC116587_34190 [Pseudoteredinibacter isoporae]
MTVIFLIFFWSVSSLLYMDSTHLKKQHPTTDPVALTLEIRKFRSSLPVMAPIRRQREYCALSLSKATGRSKLNFPNKL